MANLLLKRIKDWATSITAFRTGDVIPVDGPSGTAKMSKDALLELTAQNAYKNGRVDALDKFSVYFSDKSTEYAKTTCTELSVGIGNVVNLGGYTANSFRGVVKPCVKGQVFKVKGRGDSDLRLWGFTDSDMRLVAVSSHPADEGDYITLFAPADGYIAVNAFGSTGGLLVQSSVDDKAKAVDNDIVDVNDRVSYSNNEGLLFVDDMAALSSGYIALDVGIGNIVTLTPTAQSDFVCTSITCKKGQPFKVRGVGGLSGRLWGFVDSDSKLVSVCDANVSESDYILVDAPTDGYFVMNARKLQGNLGLMVVSNLMSKIDGLDSELSLLDGYTTVDVCLETRKRACFKTSNIAIGDTMNPSYVYEAVYECIKHPCKAGDVFFVTGTGFVNHRLWMFTDSSYKVLAMSAASSTGDNLKIVAPNDGYLFFNNYCDRLDGWHMGAVRKKIDIADKFKMYDSIESPWATFNMDTDVVDVSPITDNFNMSSTAARRTTMEQVYAFMDQLVSEFPTMVTKVDLAEHLGIEYPRYANGISAGDQDYEETPAYKTYMYKISYSNPNVGDHYPWKFRKKKLLWVSGVHGGEVLACVNSAVFVYRLLHNCLDDDNLFKILSAFDVYVVPCVNGYGIYHLTRVNANLVNINRNYDTPNWAVAGEGTYNYTGAEPESEFETKLVCGLVRELHPDIAFDHHNYSSAKTHTYFDYAQEYMANTMYELVNLVSCALKKKYPEYFGTNFGMLADEPSHTTTEEVDRLPGQFDYWAYTQRVPVCGTFEVGDNTMYYGGVATNTSRASFSNMIFCIAEYTIRAHMVKWSELVLRIFKG